MSLSEADSICPICGRKNDKPLKQLEAFYKNLEGLEDSAGYTGKIPAAFEREYENVKTEIAKTTEQLVAVKKRIQTQSNIKNDSESEKYTIEGIARFLGQVEYARETFSSLASDSQLVSNIQTLKNRLSELKAQVNEFAIAQKIDSALKAISGYAMRLMPMLDSERPNDPLRIDYENLTVVVKSEDGRDDYLWEIGSGSNWLAYHISTLLAFQLFFNSKKHSPIPNFIVYDQPSQVYFPQKLAAKESDEKDLDPKLEKDEDQIAVKKIFNTMSKAIIASDKPLQIIVLEHADKTIYGGIDNVHEVCEWRGENNKLVPEEWI